MLRNMLPVVLALLAIAGCASREPKLHDEVSVAGLPAVRRISFTGNEHFLAFTLRQQMETQGRPLLQPWKRGEAFNPATLDDDILRLRRFYFQRGFLNASVTIEGLHEDPEADAVDIALAIVEGDETFIETLKIAGTVPPELPSAEGLLEELPLRPGDRLSKELFDRSVAGLIERMGNAGYAQADVVPDTQVDPVTQKAAVIFNLVPGARRTIGSVVVKGADQVPNHVIERTITLREGDTFSRETVSQSRQHVFDLGMFRNVTARTPNVHDAEVPVDIEFEVRERKPRSVQFSVGVSSIESARFGAKWTHRNIFEEANSLSVFGRVSGISQYLEVDLHDPFFFSPDTRADYRAFLTNKETITSGIFGIFDIEDPYPAYDFLTGGAEWRVEHDVTKRLGGIAGLELTTTDFFNIDLSPEDAAKEGAVDNQLFVQFIEGQWNNRDNNLNPTSGELIRVTLDHSNTAVISDVNFAKLQLEGRYYHRVARRTVLAGRLRVGGIEPYGSSTSVPGNVRFFAGGPGSVRGYQLNRLGPLDANGNPIGGHSLIEGSVEIRYPIIGSLGGTAFLDFGNVFEPAFTYRLDDLKYAVGAGLTYETPVGPVRAELAHAIDPEDSDLTNLFFFSIGHAF